MLRGGGRGLSGLCEEEFGLGGVREGVLGIVKARRILVRVVEWGTLSRRSELILSLSMLLLLCEKSSSSSVLVLILTLAILQEGEVG
jgi:hypothetical protein